MDRTPPAVRILLILLIYQRQISHRILL